MARTVASLSVSINARTKGLRKGLQKARNQIGDFSKSVTGAIGRVAKLGAGLGALTAGVAAIGTGKAMSSLNDLAKTARKLSISPTALVGLRDAAKETGVDVKTLDMGLQRMLRRVQEAAKGRGEALPVLKELGLDAAFLSRMKPEKQFETIAKAMARMQDDGQDLARAMKLFDSEGVALVNTLRLVNEKGLKPFIENAKNTGRGGGLLEDRLKFIERIMETLGRLKDRIAGIFQQLALSVGVPLDNLLQRFERFLSSGDVHKRMMKFFLDIRKAGYEASRAINDFFANRGKAGEFRAELTKLWGRFKEFVAWITEHLTADNVKRVFDTITRSVQATIDAVAKLTRQYREMKDLIPGVKQEAINQTSDRMLRADQAVRNPMSILKGAHKAIVDHVFSGSRPEGRGAGNGMSEGEREQIKLHRETNRLLERQIMKGTMNFGIAG